LVSSGCWKTPSPTPARPTPAPPTPAPAPAFSSQTHSGTVVNPKTGYAEARAKMADGLSDTAGKWQIVDVPAGNGTLSYTRKILSQ